MPASESALKAYGWTILLIAVAIFTFVVIASSPDTRGETPAHTPAWVSVETPDNHLLWCSKEYETCVPQEKELQDAQAN